VETLRVGVPCYFDSFAGLIPGRVVSVVGESGPCSTAQTVRIAITARQSRVYKLGEVITCSGLHAVPRRAVRWGKYGSKIRFYQVEVI
jgi:hypothetical protein